MSAAPADAVDLAAWLGPAKEKTSKKRAFTMTKASWGALIIVAEGMLKNAVSWEEATPGHLLAAYALLHRQVYGQEAPELAVAKTRAVMAAHVRRFVDEQFGGKVAEVVEFLRWTWRKEANDERRRREEKTPSDWRVTPRYQFSAAMATRYRMARARAAGR